MSQETTDTDGDPLRCSAARRHVSSEPEALDSKPYVPNLPMIKVSISFPLSQLNPL